MQPPLSFSLFFYILMFTVLKRDMLPLLQAYPKNEITFTQNVLLHFRARKSCAVSQNETVVDHRLSPTSLRTIFECRFSLPHAHALRRTSCYALHKREREKKKRENFEHGYDAKSVFVRKRVCVCVCVCVR